MARVKTVAQLVVDAAPVQAPKLPPTEALGLELKKRIAAKEPKPAGSIREALARWLEEEM